jgi:sodium/bile acid cotransporter 7
MLSAIRRFAPDYFILSLFGAIIVASLLPARGDWAHVVDIVTTAAIVLLFFLHGVRLERRAVIAALTHWPLHLVILGSTFVLFPLLGLGLHAVLRPAMPEQLWLGVLFLCALPSTVQSSIAFTSIARGNVAGAVAAAATSNILGVALAPVSDSERLSAMVFEVFSASLRVSSITARENSPLNQRIESE